MHSKRVMRRLALILAMTIGNVIALGTGESSCPAHGCGGATGIYDDDIADDTSGLMQKGHRQALPRLPHLSLPRLPSLSDLLGKPRPDCPKDRLACEYRIPTDVTEDTPLLIMLHGFTQNGSHFHEMLTKNTHDPDAMGKVGMVIAFPSGRLEGESGHHKWGVGIPPTDLGLEFASEFGSREPVTGQRTWRVGIPPGMERPDVHFNRYTAEDIGDDIKYLTKTMVDDIRRYIGATSNVKNWKPRHIFASGISSGAVMTYTLAIAGVVDAIVPVAGALYEPLAKIEPRHPVSVVAFHGTEDPVTWINGDLACVGKFCNVAPYVSVARVMRFWSERDGISFAPEERSLHTAGSVNATGDVVHRTWHTPGSAFPRVELYTDIGAKHAWPTVESAGIDAIMVMKRFFWDFTNYYAKTDI